MDFFFAKKKVQTTITEVNEDTLGYKMFIVRHLLIQALLRICTTDVLKTATL
jgi:hypothetical protein